MKKSMKKICVFLAVLLAVVALPVSAQADGRKKQTIQASSMTVKVDQKNKRLNAKAKTTMSYKSSNPSVLGVSAKGVLTPKKGGTVKVTIYAKGTTKYFSAKKDVTVKVLRASQSVQASNMTVFVGESGKKIGAKAKTTMSYKSSNPSVLGVSAKGVFTPKREGTVTVRINAKATSKYTSATKTITIDVRRLNPAEVTLKPGRKYSNYDITGDQEEDTILVKQTRGYANHGEEMYRGLDLYINGRKWSLLEGNDMYYYNPVKINLYTLKNGKPFLELYANSDNDYPVISVLYQCEGERLECVVDFMRIFGNYGRPHRNEMVSVKGNTMKIRQSMMSYSTGISEIDFDYGYMNGTLQPISGVGTYTYTSLVADGQRNRGILNAETILYSAPGGNAELLTIPEGGRVSVLRCKMVNHAMYIQVSYNGTIGWLEAQEGYEDKENRLFANVEYTG